MTDGEGYDQAWVYSSAQDLLDLANTDCHGRHHLTTPTRSISISAGNGPRSAVMARPQLTHTPLVGDVGWNSPSLAIANQNPIIEPIVEIASGGYDAAWIWQELGVSSLRK